MLSIRLHAPPVRACSTRPQLVPIGKHAPSERVCDSFKRCEDCTEGGRGSCVWWIGHTTTLNDHTEAVGSCIGESRLADSTSGSLGGLPNNMFRTYTEDVNSSSQIRYATLTAECSPGHSVSAEDVLPQETLSDITSFKSCARWTDVVYEQESTPDSECRVDICPVGSNIFLYTKNYMTWHAQPGILTQQGEDEGGGTRHCSKRGGFSELNIDWGRSLRFQKKRDLKAELEREAECGCVPNAQMCAGPVFGDPEPHMAEFCVCPPGGKVIFGNPNGFSNPHTVPSGANGVACTIAMFGNPVVGTNTKYGSYDSTGQWKYCFCEPASAPPARQVPTFSAFPVAFEFRPEVNQCR